MVPIIYRCPNTRLNVQTLLPDDKSEEGSGEVYVTITCSAFRQIHLVNPKTRKTLLAEDE